MIFVVKPLFSQKLTAFSAKPAPPPTTKNYLIGSGQAVKINWLKLPAGNAIAPDLYYQRLGFFCKQELQLQKITRVPFRFRLGSMENCDHLEGKYLR
jgi:hypothetical protein